MRSIPVLVALALSASLAAQVPTLRTKSVIGVTVDYKTTTTKRYYKSIPANTPITGEVEVKAGFRTPGWFGPTGEASTKVTAHLGARSSSVYVLESAGAGDKQFNGQFELSTSTTKPKQPHEWLLTVPARAAGNTLSIWVHARTSWPGLAIDVGDDGKYEFVHVANNQKQTQLLNLGTRATTIRIVTYLANDWANSVSQYVEASLVLNPRGAFKFRTYGTGCGITLTGTSNLDHRGHNTRLVVDGLFANSPVLFVWGVQSGNYKIYPRNCSLLVNPLLVVPIASNGFVKRGFYSVVPVTVTGKLYGQVVSTYTVNNYTNTRTSNGLEIDFGK